ncbi:MoaD/ThiS family protein [Streptomyces sp. A1547]|uniref:MoaD/ThiS family protein n=1 Tax=Streptomyces sp. A1547 TaxID=2563105 RepID=UPI00109E9C8D|nr:MoaD/ThiS family protein [Streptomyces sp. A1547]THA29947.1 hypothetical protein E6W17_38720 [Streptomyces sp. A1547]
MSMVTFTDETTAVRGARGRGVEIAEDRLALRELIRLRVSRDAVDPKACTALALTAFRRSGFLVMVDNRRVRDLDEEIDLRPGTEVTFLKLALAGG